MAQLFQRSYLLKISYQSVDLNRVELTPVTSPRLTKCKRHCFLTAGLVHTNPMGNWYYKEYTALSVLFHYIYLSTHKKSYSEVMYDLWLSLAGFTHVRTACRIKKKCRLDSHECYAMSLSRAGCECRCLCLTCFLKTSVKYQHFWDWIQ